jgi:hypothetical protein
MCFDNIIASDNPNPVPCPVGFAVKDGLKILSNNLEEIITIWR